MINTILGGWISHSWISNGLLFAQIRIRRARGNSQHLHDTQMPWWQVLVLSVVVIALVYALYKWHKPLAGFIRHNPCWLFWKLCVTHKLDWSSCWLLCRLAFFHRMKNPIRLFLQPARMAPENLGPDWEFEAPQLEALREKLFGVKAEG